MGFEFSKKINYEYFITNFTPESVYILGLLWADGTINKKGNGISIECIEGDMDYFYKIFQTTGNYGFYTRNRINRKTQKTIACSSKELSIFLKENDYTIKSNSSPTKILDKIPIHLKKYFFIGWSDGDGCFYYNENQYVTQYVMSGSYDQDWSSLSIQCEKLSVKFKINRIITKLGHKHSSFRISNMSDTIKFGDFLYENYKIGLKRKYDKFNLIKDYFMKRKSTKILCYNKNNEKIMEFDSLISASSWVNKKRNVSSDINDACAGRQKTAFGFIWEKI